MLKFFSEDFVINKRFKIMEERKLKEIEHSRQRREILQGFERQTDAHSSDQVDLEDLISDKEAFKKHFSNMKYYAVTRASEQYQTKWIEDNCSDSTKVLDFACGNGENGILAAQQGSVVMGIDISPEGIENAKKNAEALNVSSLCNFEVMDGENMTFEDNTFDVGVEYGALHHVDLPVTLKELARVLKPNGKMVCVEAMRHNPLIHLYRKLTPHLRTEWEVEHILGVESFDEMYKCFDKVDVKYFHLISLFLVPFRKFFFFPFLLSIFEQIDQFILSNNFIGKYGWIMVVELSNPKK